MSEAGLASLCVVVPCFNEAAVIGAFHARLMAALDALPVSAQVLYVDDGSRDRTAAAIAALCAADPRVGRARLKDVGLELPPLLERLRRAGRLIEDIDVRGPSLQAVFIHLTGRELRE